MPNKIYLIISIGIIAFIGIFAVFNAGYSPESEPVKSDVTEDVSESSQEKNDEQKENGEAERDEEDKQEELLEEVKETTTKKGTVEKVENHPNQLVNCKYELKGIPSPKAVAFRPETEEIWVTSLMNKRYGVVVFNTETGQRTEIQLPDGGGVEIIFNKTGSKAYVSQMETGRVFQINGETKIPKKTYSTESTWSKVMELSKNEETIYVSNWSGNDVSKINLEDKSTERISTVRTPRGIYLSRNKLYVAGFANGEIQKMDPETGDFEVLIETGGAMRTIVGDREHLYVSDMALSAIYRVEKETGETKPFLETDNNPNTIRLTPDKKILIVSNRGINHPSGDYSVPGPEWGSVLFFDVQSGEILDALVAGNQTTGLDIDGEGAKLVYSDFLDGKITVCEIPTYEEFMEADGGRSENYKDDLIK